MTFTRQSHGHRKASARLGDEGLPGCEAKVAALGVELNEVAITDVEVGEEELGLEDPLVEMRDEAVANLGELRAIVGDVGEDVSGERRVRAEVARAQEFAVAVTCAGDDGAGGFGRKPRSRKGDPNARDPFLNLVTVEVPEDEQEAANGVCRQRPTARAFIVGCWSPTSPLVESAAAELGKPWSSAG